VIKKENQMPQQPNVGSGLLRTHACVTRALGLSIERGQAFVRQGFPNPSMRQGYLDYCRCLVSTLHAHHLAEEEIIFPFVARLLPDVPYADLLAEHQIVVALLEQIKPEIEAVASAAHPSTELTQLAATLQELLGIWRPHIHKEETSFTVARLADLISVAEHIRLLKEISEHALKTSEPDYLVVPFMLFNLSPEARAAVAAEMPPIVSQQLVPVVWKDKWAPMQPFLLP
jgi:hemerythrin-like domain-containing protein